MSNPFMFNGTEEQLDALANNRLLPHDQAIQRSGNTVWFELVQVQDIAWELPDRRSENQGERSDDMIGQLLVKMVIDPGSPGSKNVGRRLTDRLRFNSTALGENRDALTTRFSRRDYGKLMQFVKALALDPKLAKDPLNFPNHSAEVVGRRVTASISHRAGEKGIFENIELFAPEETIYEVYGA